MAPKVSVIVPVYNVEQYLDRCIQSLLNQTLKEIEIILVDDESPDKCPQMCDYYSKQDVRIKVIHKKNEGLGMACNSGMEIAKGEYIAFCDSDDYVDKNMYETMYRAAIEEQADVVFTGIQTVNQEGIVKPMSQPKQKETIRDKAYIHRYLLNMIASEPSVKEDREVPMSAKVALYRHEMIANNHLRFESERILISEDLIWHIDILCHAKCICLLPQTFYYYYNNTKSLSKKIRTDRFSYFLNIRQEIVRRTKQYNLINEVGIRTDRMFIGYVRFYIRQICSSSMTYSEKRSLVIQMCTDKVWKEIWSTYPIRLMPKGHYVMMYLMKYRLFSIINLMYKLMK